MQRFELEKRIWSEVDFDRMGWHDVKVHAMAFFPDAFEFALDLDYHFRWVDPQKDGGYYRYWQAPATLVFENVHDLRIDVDASSGLDVDVIERTPLGAPHNAEFIGRDLEWEWAIECQQGLIGMKSVGYKMHVRSEPRLQVRLSLEERGGICFDRIKA